MRSSHAIGMLMITLPLLWGCTGSKVPLSSSEGARIDQRLVGVWESVDPEEGEFGRVLILQFNEHEYYAEYCSEMEGGEAQAKETDSTDALKAPAEELPDAYRLRFFSTPVADAMFANVQCIDCDDRSYLLFRYEISGDSLVTIREVSEEVYESEFDTSEALHAFVRDNLEREEFYEYTLSLRRLHDELGCLNH